MGYEPIRSFLPQTQEWKLNERRRWEQHFTQVQKHATIINYPFVWWSLDEFHLVFYRPASLRRLTLTIFPPSISRFSREHVGASTSHNPIGLHGLLQGYLCRYRDVTGWTTTKSGFDSHERQERFVFSAAPRTPLRLTRSLLQRVLKVVCSAVKRPEREGGDLFQYSAEMKNSYFKDLINDEEIFFDNIL
jgi:hypothetical protein